MVLETMRIAINSLPRGRISLAPPECRSAATASRFWSDESIKNLDRVLPVDGYLLCGGDASSGRPERQGCRNGQPSLWMRPRTKASRSRATAHLATAPVESHLNTSWLPSEVRCLVGPNGL